MLFTALSLFALTAPGPSLSLASPNPAVLGAVSDDEQVVYRGRKKLPVGELPDSLEDGERSAIEAWAGWCGTHAYRMDLSKDGRVLLLTLDDKKGRKAATKNLALIESVLEAMDKTLPMPPTRMPAASEEEDDDEDTEWGYVPRETQTAVLIQIDQVEHQVAAVDTIVEAFPYLESWGNAVGTGSGFVLQSPLVGTWQPKIGIKEDYEGSPTNEMVNRLAQMMTLRRFGRQPYWLSMGIAWHAEMNALDTIYCFPYRTGFVSSAEHENWNKLLENRLRRRKEPLNMGEVANLRRGQWNTNGAHMAWGTVEFLARFHPQALPKILDELYILWDEEGRTEDEDGNWERISGFEPDLQDQLEVFEKHVPDFLKELLRFFAKGKLYKP